MSEEARQQQAEGLTLLKADNKTGYFGVYLDKSCKTKPYRAQVKRGGKDIPVPRSVWSRAQGPGSSRMTEPASDADWCVALRAECGACRVKS